jgi:hypothetical protein
VFSWNRAKVRVAGTPSLRNVVSAQCFESMNTPTSETTGQNGHKAGMRPIDTIINAMRTGAEDARRAAEEAIPKLKYAASRASYWAAYGASFAAAFEWTLASVGGREGIRAGKEAAQRWLERVKRGGKAESSGAVPPLIGPAREENQPGVPPA